MTISLPPAMAKQMEKVQKEEHRTRSELLREAWRQYFENRCQVYNPSKTETAALRKGRAAFKRGEFVTLNQLHNELDSARHQARKKTSKLPSRDQLRIEAWMNTTRARQRLRAFS